MNNAFTLKIVIPSLHPIYYQIVFYAKKIYSNIFILVLNSLRVRYFQLYKEKRFLYVFNSRNDIDNNSLDNTVLQNHYPKRYEY